jgi:ATP-dependent Clp protease ATP-binding subunit ClpC
MSQRAQQSHDVRSPSDFFQGRNVPKAPRDLQISDPRVQAVLMEAGAVFASPIDLTAIACTIISQADEAITNLIKPALPRDYTVAALTAQVSAREGAKVGSENAVAGEIVLTPRAIKVLENYERLYRSDRTLDFKVFLGCVLEQLGPVERSNWRPLDLDVLIEACAPRPGQPAPVRNDSAPVTQNTNRLWENLTERVRNAGRDGLSPFDDNPAYAVFFDNFCRALHRSTPRHVLIIGERGVAEHAALLEMARRGISGRPPFLRDKQFMLVHCRHMPPDQVPMMIESVFMTAGASENIIICLDGLSNLLRSCNLLEANRSMLLSALLRTACRIAGIVSGQEFEEYFSGDGELQEFFSTVPLLEPEPQAAKKLVRHFAAGLEVQFGMHIEDAAIDRSVVLSDSYILHERLPYKAVKVLRAVCDDMEYERTQNGSDCATITEAEVLAKISQISGVPVATLAGMGDGIDYHQSFRDVIVGQDHAINEVATELGLIKAGMIDAGKPASVIMFVGQTGTGKTETAKVLARLYSSSKRLKTFTLGNFSEPHSVSGIIGVPPGYVGHDQGGRLINELNSDPYGVFLLDEADKAHPDVMQPFLNLFDEGWIADQKGNRAFANRAIFILTTNVGQRQIADMWKSGKTIEEITSTARDLLARIRHSKSNRPVFTAEFLARIRRFVVFRSLDRNAMEGICHLIASNMQHDWLLKRQKVLELPESLVQAIGRRAFEIDEKAQGREGGRIVRKLIADVVEAKILRAISENPQAYRVCHIVQISHAPPANVCNATSLAEGVTVGFA